MSSLPHDKALYRKMIQRANKSLQVAQGPSQNFVPKPTFAGVKSAYVYKIQQKSGRKGVC